VRKEHLEMENVHRDEDQIYKVRRPMWFWISAGIFLPTFGIGLVGGATSNWFGLFGGRAEGSIWSLIAVVYLSCAIVLTIITFVWMGDQADRTFKGRDAFVLRMCGVSLVSISIVSIFVVINFDIVNKINEIFVHIKYLNLFYIGGVIFYLSSSYICALVALERAGTNQG